MLGVSGGQGEVIQSAVEEAAQCRLQARRRLVRRQDGRWMAWGRAQGAGGSGLQIQGSAVRIPHGTPRLYSDVRTSYVNRKPKNLVYQENTKTKSVFGISVPNFLVFSLYFIGILRSLNVKIWLNNGIFGRIKIGLVFGFCGCHFIGIGLVLVCHLPENDISSWERAQGAGGSGVGCWTSDPGVRGSNPTRHAAALFGCADHAWLCGERVFVFVYFVYFNPRRTGGLFRAPSRFLAISSEQMLVSPPNLQYPLSNNFTHCVKILKSRVS